MTDEVAGAEKGTAEKGMSEGAQVVAALVVVGAIVGGIWVMQKVLPDQSSADRGPATCSTSHDALPARYVSGAKLCAALNRPDLPKLLGTPAEQAETANGSGDYITLAGGTKIPSPEANVTLRTYSVKLSASYDRLRVAGMADLLGTTAQTKTVLGHPAVLYSDRTISITLGGGKADTGPGGIARCLLVARDAKDGGGSFEVVIWRQDDVVPDDTALLRVAEEVLPTVPGWKSG